MDLSTLRGLSLEDLRARGIEDVEALRLQRALSRAAGVRGGVRRQSAVSERRLLTLLFCDLIDSTLLSAKLDPEDWAEVLSSYIETVARHTEGYDGFVAKVVGDGVFVYFGYPRAHEDDASRALHAALSVTDAVRSLSVWPDVALGVRIGIATGPVVVRDMAAGGFTEHEAVVGETPNLAARLQSVAEENWIVVSDGTHDLAREEFDYVDLGSRELRGFDEPIRCWRVVAPRRIESRFLARHPLGSEEFVGREDESATLFEAWRLAREGRGRVVMVEGEPGIGKSRLVSNLYASARDATTTRMIFQCSELSKDTALHPVSAYFEYVCRIKPEDDPESRLQKLSQFVRSNIILDEQAIGLMARLMSIGLGVPAEIAQLPPAQFKERLFSALIEWVTGLAAHQPLFIVVEDVHWMDATTSEFLNQMVKAITEVPILLVLTTRGGGFDLGTVEDGCVLRLARLEPKVARSLVALLTSETTLSQLGIDRIVEQTDGNPLFIQQAVRVLADRALSEHDADASGLGPSITLQQVLQARLDSLGRTKRVAQFAAILGRQFSKALLRATWPFEEDALEEGLEVLEREGLIAVRRLHDGVEYRFAHALIVDAAYSSLLKRDRREFHRQVAQVLEASFGDLSKREPHLLANHYAAAGEPRTAVPFFVKAAELALTRSAYVEARNHLEQGFANLADIADGEERDRLELALRPPFGAVIVATRGYATKEVDENYQRILDLARRHGDIRFEFHALLGLTRAAIVLAEIAKARALSGDLLGAAHKLGQPELVLTAELLVGIAELMAGDLNNAHRHLSIAHAAYDPVRDRLLAHRLGQDPGCTALVWLAMHAWLGGHLARYRTYRADALALARDLEHPFTLGYALVRLVAIDRLSGDLEAARALAVEASALARSRGFPAFDAAARFWLAELAIDEDGDAAHLDEMEKEISANAPTDQRNNIGFMLLCLAERAFALGDPKRAADALDRCADAIAETDVRWCEAELYRLRGRHALSGGDKGAAAAWFAKAAEIAEGQGACFLRLRACVDLAQLQSGIGNRVDAIAVLDGACRTLSDEVEGIELDAARTLLSNLQAAEREERHKANAS
ncbi:ATP-binding protein [Acuticoccus kandeliae]|uniref:ATP-binding protein n=1 Tax=Acuticoccus kandeliae TaxID=2073160 RepID=UPI0014728FF1|nr:adenylate/guanylate cyclase domain-containing protein [Acuticoccus kandeliae]